ncbi:hypothetical protein BC937DRAFT_89949, partial [Endogone sp. FLAS-F59071]
KIGRWKNIGWNKKSGREQKPDAKKTDFKTIIASSAVTIQFALWLWVISPYEAKACFQNQLDNELNAASGKKRRTKTLSFAPSKKGSYSKSQGKLITHQSLTNCKRSLVYHLVVGERRPSCLHKPPIELGEVSFTSNVLRNWGGSTKSSSSLRMFGCDIHGQV